MRIWVGTRGSGVLASAGDVLEISVVRCVGGVCAMCMCLARGGVGGVRVSRPQDWVWALPIQEEHVESGVCCVLVAVVWGGVGREWVGSLGQGRVLRICLGGWGGVMSVYCESGLSVLMAGPVICILC